MAVEPVVEVTEESVVTQDRTPGMAGRIAVIGAFNSKVTDITGVSDETDPQVVQRVREAGCPDDR